jgi:UPF0716 protein FxsA
MRTPPILLLLLLWPVAEILSMMAMADAIGALPAFALIVLGVGIGIAVLKYAGRSALAELRAEAQRSGIIDARIFAGASRLALAGVLFIVPGFLSDLTAIYLGVSAMALSSRRQRAPVVIDVAVDRRLDDNRPGGAGF